MKTAAVLSTFLAAAAANPLRVRNFFHNKVENELPSTTTTSMVHVPSGGYSQQSDSVGHHQHHHIVHPTGTGYRTGAARPTGTGYRTGAASPTGVPTSSGYGNSTSSGNGTTSQGTSNYKQFNGDGSTAAGWPAMSDWVSDFDSLWDINKNTISISCGYVQTTYDSAIVNPSDNEMSQIKDAIKSVSDASKFDPRFVLAIMMQETSGCPRIYNTTSPGSTPVNNPGLLQDHNGVHSCNTGILDTTTMKYTKGKVQNPCPQNQINGMIDDGVNGTPTGPGLLKSVDQGKTQGSGDAQAYYIGARLYNSGATSYNGQDLGAPGATRCYSSDVANRLIGFNGPKSGCTLGQPQPSSS